MKSAATCKPSTAGATLTPPGTATATSRTATAGSGGAAGDPASLEARIAAFKADPALMEVATRFVTEVLERAKEEASKRLRERDGAAPQMAEGANGTGGAAREREKLRLKDRADSLRAVGRSLAEVIRQQSVDGMRRLRRVWTRVQQHAAE